MPLWASSIRGEQAQKEVLYMEAETNWQKAQQTHQLEYLQSVRALQAAYLGAVAANEALKNWNIAIKEQDRLFRQGRVDVTQIILDYNSYYRTLSERSQAIGDYHMALNAYAAARDKLVE
jgi:outer membrane protein TolC